MAVQLRNKYVLGEFELETDKYLLKHNNEHIHLPELPFQVLLYLVDNRQRYVSRRELLDRFWAGSDAYEETLTKCISTIRTQLKDPPTTPRFIETRKKVGYRYIGPFQQSRNLSESNAAEFEHTRGLEIVVEEEDDLPPVIQLNQPSALLAKSTTSIQPKLSTRTGLLALIVVLGLATFGVWSYRRRAVAPPTSIRSVAVLPFKNLSGDQSEDYFSDGLTDSLITSLSKVEGLKVISSSSVFHFKGQQVDPSVVAKQLDVTAVLEGTVRKDQDSVRVTVRMVNAQDGRVLWVSDTKERSLRDIFGLQDDIAHNVVSRLSLQLDPEGQLKLNKHHTSNVEAYQLYLRGRYHWDKWTATDLSKAIDYFQQAIHFDPNYALAYSGLADSYSALTGVGGAPPNEVMPKAKEAALRAIQLDNTLAEAHTSLGMVLVFYDWDYRGAEREFKRAIELNPNSSTAHYLYGKLLPDITGRFEEAFVEIDRALKLDPLSLGINKDLGELFYYSRQFDRAIEQWEKTRDLDPRLPIAYTWLSRAYEVQGRYDLAIETLFKRYELGGMSDAKLSELKSIYAKEGWRGYWLAQLEWARKQQFKGYSEPYFKVWYCLYAGEKQQALLWLEKAHESRSPWIPTIKYDPALDSLRSEPRFKNLMQRVEAAN